MKTLIKKHTKDKARK